MTSFRGLTGLGLLMGFSLGLCVGVRAQEAPLPLDDPAAPGMAGAGRVREINDDNLNALSLPAFGSVSLRASLAAMQNAPTQAESLRRWVARGNVVFLHTDAAESFGFGTIEARSATADVGGLLAGRARAALGFCAHPLLGGEEGASAPLSRGANPTRLPGVRSVFYLLREGDAFVDASDVATPLLQVEDPQGDERRPLYAAAIVSVGAGWAIFCPEQLDGARGDGALFGQLIRGFVPDASGARWVGLPSRVLAASASPSLVRAALGNRLSAAAQSNQQAALPAFGTAPAAPIAAGTPAPEPVLPLRRDEASAIYNALAGPNAARVVALLQARLQWQLGQTTQSARSLEVAAGSGNEAADPALATQVAFLNGCFQAQTAADVSLDAATKARAADAAARSFAAVASVNGRMNNQTGMATGGVWVPVAAGSSGAWSRAMSRLAAVWALSPPQAQFYSQNGASATLRFFNGDGNAAALGARIESLLRDERFGPRAPHIEVLLLPSVGSYAGVRRALGAPSNGTVVGGEVVGNTVLLASGGADAAAFSRAWTLASLSSWTDSARSLPAWVVVGAQGRAVGLNDTLSLNQNNTFEVLPAVLAGSAPVTPVVATALWNFLVDQYGIGARDELVARLAAGASLDQAMQAATGDDASAFVEAFRRDRGA